MPITRVITNLTDFEHHRSIARVATEVFSSLGLSDEHITTTVTAITGENLFVGTNTFADTFGEDHFAHITVSLGSQRGTDVRSRLATAFTMALRAVVAPSTVGVDFTVREGGDVYVGGIAMGRATAWPGSTEQTAHPTSDLDERLR